MGEGIKSSPSDLDERGWAVLSEAVWALEDSWRAKSGADLAEHLPPAGDPLRNPVLAELIKVDQEYRWRSGSRKLLEEYLDEWPDLSREPERLTELLQAECLTRAVLGDTIPTIEEVRSRFPRLAEQIDLAERIDLAAIAAQARAERASAQHTMGGLPPLANDASQSPLPLGEPFGRYQIRELLGHGGMGWVYLAYDTQMEIEVALKIPAPHVDRDRFLREGRTLAKVRHRNICPIYNVDEIGGLFFISMALIEGEPLTTWMENHRVDPRQACGLVAKVARALGKLHQAEILHRDIKPHNIMVDQSGEPILMDFGLARPIEASRGYLAGDSELAGTFHYMSPEQLRGQQLDPRSDLFSLGVVLYQLVTGELPFGKPLEHLGVDAGRARQPQPRRPSEARPRLDPRLDKICLKAIATSPDDRYGSADEMADALERYAARRRWPARLAGICVAVAAVLLAGMIYLKTGEGTLQVVLSHPDATLTIDGEEVDLPGPNGRIAVDVGSHALTVTRLDYKSASDSFTIRWRGQSVVKIITLDEEPHIQEVLFAAGPERTASGGCALTTACLSGTGSKLFVAAHRTLAGSAEAILQELDLSAEGPQFRTLFSQAKPDPYILGLALSGDGRYLYFTNYHFSYMSRIDLHNANARTDLEVGGVPGAVWATVVEPTPDQRKLVVLLGDDNRSYDLRNDQLSIVDIEGGKFTLAGQVPLNDEPVSPNIGFTSDSRLAYVVTRKRRSAAPTLYEISLTEPYRVSRILPFPGGDLRGVAVSNKHRRLFVSDANCMAVHVVSLDDFQLLRDIRLFGHAPGPLAIDRQESLLVVLCPLARKLLCLDPADGHPIGGASSLEPYAWEARFTADGLRLVVPHRTAQGDVAVFKSDELSHRVVFASDRKEGANQLYVTALRGSKPVLLTDGTANHHSPRWSPDGRKLAFVSDLAGPPRVCLMGRGGGELRVLDKTDPVVTDNGGCLDWSPDGTEIAFLGDGHRTIRAVDLRTENVRTLLAGAVGRGYSHHMGLCWSRSDGRVFFNTCDPANGNNQDIFALDPRTAEIEQITDEWALPSHFLAPAASPDGTRLVVARDAGVLGQNRFLALLDPAARPAKPTPLTDTAMQHDNPRWFPDGGRIIYSAGPPDRRHIYSISAAGGPPTQLTDGNCNDTEPDIWGR